MLVSDLALSIQFGNCSIYRVQTDCKSQKMSIQPSLEGHTVLLNLKEFTLGDSKGTRSGNFWR